MFNVRCRFTLLPVSFHHLTLLQLLFVACMQALSRDSSEARLFWHLLDETQGEDWATFYSYALSVLEVM
jgi:hypothetical protein